MKAIILSDQLDLIPPGETCSHCGLPARWKHDEAPCCGTCYLYSITKLGHSSEFKYYIEQIRSNGCKAPDEGWDDYVLSILVLTNRLFRKDDLKDDLGGSDD